MRLSSLRASKKSLAALQSKPSSLGENCNSSRPGARKDTRSTSKSGDSVYAYTPFLISTLLYVS